MAIHPTHWAFSWLGASIMSCSRQSLSLGTLTSECVHAYPSPVCPIRYMNPLRIMSFNIRLGLLWDASNRWYKRRDLVFDVIRRFSPHIVGIQEAFPYQLDELLCAFPGFGAIADRRYGGRLTGTHAPLLFHRDRLEPAQSGDFWLSPDPDGGRVRGWDAAVPRICTWAVFRDRADKQMRFGVSNTHFDQAGPVARAESARLVVERMQRLTSRRLLVGDMNADERSEAVEILLRAGYRDTFRVLHPEDDGCTYHGFRGRGVRSLGKIDYILCDESWTIRSAEILRDSDNGRYPSDHFPIVAELDVRV